MVTVIVIVIVIVTVKLIIIIVIIVVIIKSFLSLPKAARAQENGNHDGRDRVGKPRCFELRN